MKIRGARQWMMILAAAALVFIAVKGKSYVEAAITADGKTINERSGRVERYVLNNGLTVITEENRFSPVAALMVWVKTGSAFEDPGEFGLAHVHEHMMFKGTAKRGLGEIAGEIEGAGGDINAYTSFDETVYYLVIPSRRFELGLDVLSDVVFNSSFDPDELKKELEVVLEEIKRGYDSPSTVLSYALFETAYKKHSYGRPIIGTEEGVSALTREKVLNFFHKWYTPENMVVAAVGDFDSDEANKLIKKYFGSAKRNTGKGAITADTKVIPQEPKQTEPRFKIIKGDVSEAYLEIAFHIPDINGPDVPALDVMGYILGSGESSRLYRAVQSESGLVNSVHCYTFTPREPGVAIIGATLKPKNFFAAIDSILREIARFKTEPPGTEEMSRAKDNIESEAVYARETVQGEARKLGFYEVIARNVDFEEGYLRAVDKVAGQDIIDAANKYFDPNNLTIAAYLPESTKESNIDEAALEKLSREALTVTDKKADTEGVKKIVLPNGLTVLIKEYHGVPLVAYRLAMLGGVRLDPPEQRGLTHFIARTISKGTAKRDAAEIAAEVENLSGSIGGFSGRDSLGIQAEFLSKHYARGFEIFTDVVLNPIFISKEVEQQRREIISDINRMKDKPDSLTVDLFRSTLFKNHPYGSRVMGEEEVIAKIKRRDLMTHYRSLLIPRNMVLSVVGDVAADEIMPRIRKIFGDIPSRSTTLKSPPKPKPPTKITEAKIVADKAQAQIVLGFMGPPLANEDRYAMDVLANILGGQSGRLFLELRDKLHLAYSVGAANVESLDAGIFFMYMGTRPENRQAAINGLLNELELILKEPIGEEELERAREYVAGSYEIGLQTVSSQASNLALSECYGLGWEESLKYPDMIRKVTAQDVWEVAKKYLGAEKYVITELAPANKSETESK